MEQMVALKSYRAHVIGIKTEIRKSIRVREPCTVLRVKAVMKIAEPGMKSLRAGDFKAGNGSSRNNELPVSRIIPTYYENHSIPGHYATGFFSCLQGSY